MKKNSQGYILIRTPDHPYCDNQKYVREHRLVMENKLGRYLEKNEVVHHINGVKTDNRVENLVVLLKRDHDRLSILERPKKEKIEKICPECEKRFRVYISLARIKCYSNSCSKKLLWKTKGKIAFGR